MSLWTNLLTSIKRAVYDHLEARCKKHGGHVWVVSRHWDFRDWPGVYVQIPASLGHDATCQACGKKLLTFKRTEEVLRACRHVKGSVGFNQDRHVGQVLNREVGPLLGGVCLPKDSTLWPRRAYRGHPVAEDFNPREVYHYADRLS
jgi:hypothetical protein